MRGRSTTKRAYAENPPKRSRRGFVYFVQELPRGPIKIGWATSPVAVKRRFDTLRVGNPRELAFRGFMEGPHALEQHLHWHFAEDNVRGEWFWPSSALDLLVRVIEARTLEEPLDEETKADYRELCDDIVFAARAPGGPFSKDDDGD